MSFLVCYMLSSTHLWSDPYKHLRPHFTFLYVCNAMHHAAFSAPRLSVVCMGPAGNLQPKQHCYSHYNVPLLGFYRSEASVCATADCVQDTQTFTEMMHGACEEPYLEPLGEGLGGSPMPTANCNAGAVVYCDGNAEVTSPVRVLALQHVRRRQQQTEVPARGPRGCRIEAPSDNVTERDQPDPFKTKHRTQHKRQKVAQLQNQRDEYNSIVQAVVQSQEATSKRFTEAMKGCFQGFGSIFGNIFTGVTAMSQGRPLQEVMQLANVPGTAVGPNAACTPAPATAFAGSPWAAPAGASSGMAPERQTRCHLYLQQVLGTISWLTAVQLHSAQRVQQVRQEAREQG